MAILGYGEDAFTLWAVGAHAGQLLRTLGDETPSEDAIVFYRPSFGRRGSSREGTEVAMRSAFGEFDAIIGTPVGTYLIETKWSASSEFRGPVLLLAPQQVRRHDVMRCYLEEWRATGAEAWTDFTRRSAIAERLRTLDVSIARAGTRIAESLRFVLGMLANCGPVRDVVLFMRMENDVARTRFGSPPTEVSADRFSLLTIDCRACPGSGGFISLPALSRTDRPSMRLAGIQQLKRVRLDAAGPTSSSASITGFPHAVSLPPNDIPGEPLNAADSYRS